MSRTVSRTFVSLLMTATEPAAAPGEGDFAVDATRMLFVDRRARSGPSVRTALNTTTGRAPKVTDARSNSAGSMSRKAHLHSRAFELSWLRHIAAVHGYEAKAYSFHCLLNDSKCGSNDRISAQMDRQLLRFCHLR